MLDARVDMDWGCPFFGYNPKVMSMSWQGHFKVK